VPLKKFQRIYERMSFDGVLPPCHKIISTWKKKKEEEEEEEEDKEKKKNMMVMTSKETEILCFITHQLGLTLKNADDENVILGDRYYYVQKPCKIGKIVSVQY
jgi:CO dehydrogenase/acetyl-CoA synthase beta subunit